MEIEGIDFPEALEMLAKRAGVELLPRKGGRESGLTPEEAALAFFREELRGAGGTPARAYMARRGLPASAWETFELGWAPPSWDGLLRRLRAEGRSDQEILEAGLAIQGSRGLYDRFRGRIVFPIRDETGRLVGFGARILEGEEAKYVNSPEGERFAKRRLLYLLHRAKGSIRSRGRAILVEGYLDAIRCHLSGFPEAVASLGTALTEEQAARLRRLCDLCLVCFDADAAGQAATLRGLSILLAAGIEVRVVRLPEGKDPDELLRMEGGGKRFEEAIEAARPLPLFLVEARAEDLARPERRARAAEAILNDLATLSPAQRAPFRQEIARRLSLDVPDLMEELERRSREICAKAPRPGKGERAPSSVSIRGGGEEKDGPVSPPDPLEAALCVLLGRDPRFRESSAPEGLLPLIRDERAQAVAAALLYGESPEELMPRWHVLGDRFSPALWVAGEEFLERSGGLGSEVILAELRRRADARTYEALHERMAGGEATAEEMRRYQELAARLKGGHARG